MECDEHGTEAYKREEASWRRMLVAQPPLLELQISLRTGNCTAESKALILAEDGITMELLYDIDKGGICG
jgi:hypothetical protein